MKDFLKFVEKAGTDQKAAELLGITQSSVSRKKSGKQKITKQDIMLVKLSIDTLKKIAQ